MEKYLPEFIVFDVFKPNSTNLSATLKEFKSIVSEGEFTAGSNLGLASTEIDSMSLKAYLLDNEMAFLNLLTDGKYKKFSSLENNVSNSLFALYSSYRLQRNQPEAFQISHFFLSEEKSLFSPLHIPGVDISSLLARLQEITNENYYHRTREFYENRPKSKESYIKTNSIRILISLLYTSLDTKTVARFKRCKKCNNFIFDSSGKTKYCKDCAVKAKRDMELVKNNSFMRLKNRYGNCQKEYTYREPYYDNLSNKKFTPYNRKKPVERLHMKARFDIEEEYKNFIIYLRNNILLDLYSENRHKLKGKLDRRMALEKSDFWLEYGQSYLSIDKLVPYPSLDNDIYRFYSGPVELLIASDEPPWDTEFSWKEQLNHILYGALTGNRQAIMKSSYKNFTKWLFEKLDKEGFSNLSTGMKESLLYLGTIDPELNEKLNGIVDGNSDWHII